MTTLVELLTKQITALTKRNLVITSTLYIVLFSLYITLFVFDLERGDNQLHIQPTPQYNPLMGYLSIFWLLCILFELYALISSLVTNAYHKIIQRGRLIIGAAAIPYFMVKIFLPGVVYYTVDMGAFLIVIIQFAFLVSNELRVRIDLMQQEQRNGQ